MFGLLLACLTLFLALFMPIEAEQNCFKATSLDSLLHLSILSLEFCLLPTLLAAVSFVLLLLVPCTCNGCMAWFTNSMFLLRRQTTCFVNGERI